MASTVVQNVRTKLQTSKEWNENSLDLVCYWMVPASFHVLWFQTDPAVFILLTVPVCYTPFCYEYNYGIKGLPNRHVKSAKCHY